MKIEQIITDQKWLLFLGIFLFACAKPIPKPDVASNIIAYEMDCSKDNIINTKEFEKEIFAYIFNDRYTFFALECDSERIFFNEEISSPRSLKLLREAVNNEEPGFSGMIIIRPDTPPIDQFGNIWVTVEVVGPLIVESPEEYYAKAKKRLSSK